MKAVLADTGPLYALLDPDDGFHSRARAESERLESEGMGVAVAYPTLLEAYTLSVRRLGTAVARVWMQEILDACGLLNPTAEDYSDAARRLSDFPDQPIALFDATVAQLSRRLRLPVWTYDHNFDLMGVEVWR